MLSTGMPRVGGGHSVTWSDWEVSHLSSPPSSVTQALPNLILGSEGRACSRLDRYFDPQPPPRPVKSNSLLPPTKHHSLLHQNKANSLLSHSKNLSLINKPLVGPTGIGSLHPPQEIQQSPQKNDGFVDSAACKTSTWTYKHVSAQKGGQAIIEKGSRFRPERRDRERRPLQKLQWRGSAWAKGFSGRQGGDYLDLETRPSTNSSSDMSPRHAVKRILLLTENYQYRDAAAFIQRLPTTTFKTITGDLPMDVLVDAMPHSLPIIEALYCKTAELTPPAPGSTVLLRPEAVIWQMVRFFAQQEECLTGDIRWEFCGPFVTSCKKVLRVIGRSEPQIRKSLQQRRKQLDKATEGMGQHGLVGTTDESLQSLHDALKGEFDKVVKNYTQALEKLQELCLSNKSHKSISKGPAPIHSSHQRQLSITQEEVQQRLIKNKTLLNVVEPTLGNHSLDVLLGILQRRTENDKDALFQFTQLRKEAGKDVDNNAVVAPILMRYAHACEQVLEMLKEAVEEDGGVVEEGDEDDSDVSGYHSDSDSAIMMSGNSPYVSKHARFNFLTRSVRDRSHVGKRNSLPFSTAPSNASVTTTPSIASDVGSAGDSSSKSGGDLSTPEGSLKQTETSSNSSSTSGVVSAASSSSVALRCNKGHDLMISAKNRESVAQRQEVETLRAEITKARQTILHMQEREKKLKDGARMNERIVRSSPRVENMNLGERRPSVLIRRYSNLYAQACVDTLDALDALPDLKNAEELKSKLLFSVVVLSFRSASASASVLRDEVRRVLQAPPPPPSEKETTQYSYADHSHHGYDQTSETLEQAISAFITANTQKHDLTKNVDEVCQQIYATLYDYPTLKTCEGLLQYIKDCIRLAWGLSNQSPPFVIDYETRTFRSEQHVRFHMADPEKESIKTYLWPTLREGPGGPAVQKGVVIT